MSFDYRSSALTRLCYTPTLSALKTHQYFANARSMEELSRASSADIILSIRGGSATTRPHVKYPLWGFDGSLLMEVLSLPSTITRRITGMANHPVSPNGGRPTNRGCGCYLAHVFIYTERQIWCQYKKLLLDQPQEGIIMIFEYNPWTMVTHVSRSNIGLEILNFDMCIHSG